MPVRSTGMRAVKSPRWYRVRMRSSALASTRSLVVLAVGMDILVEGCLAQGKATCCQRFARDSRCSRPASGPCSALARQERCVRCQKNLDNLRSCPVKQVMCLKATLPTLDERSAHLWEQFSVSSCATVVWRHPSRAPGVFKNLTELCEVLCKTAELFGLEC